MPSRRLTGQDKRRANRARILQAARKVFALHGYHGATIGEIAGEAGLSNGATVPSARAESPVLLCGLNRRRAISSFWTSCGEPFDHPEVEAVLVFDLEAIVLDQGGWSSQEVLAAEGDGEDFKKPLDGAYQPR
jgi:Bacterial regulatory proteins, tetR family